MEKAEALAWHEESVVTVLRRENQHNKEFDMVCAVCGNCRNTVLQRFSELEIRTEIFVLCSVRWSHSRSHGLHCKCRVGCWCYPLCDGYDAYCSRGFVRFES